jgi:flavin-dependent dehydrogenase
MNSYDAIIVGAGPAGSTCAAILHRAGLNIKLFDKKVFPRVKPCAGWVTPQVMEALKIDLDEYRRAHTLQEITGFRTGILGGRMIETNYDQPVSFGIRRVEFDNYLLRRSGVCCDFQAVTHIERYKELWRVNDCVSPLLIGAGGNFCPVARHIETVGTETETAPMASQSLSPIVVFAQEVEFEMSIAQKSGDGIHPEKPELYFCRDLLGYGWCFRKGDFLNIGLGRTEKKGISEQVQAFIDFLRDSNKLIDELPSRMLGHAYRLYAQTKPRLFANGLLLIGDAAGLAYPQSGEGIRPAVESAMIAADVVANSKGKFDAQTLAQYELRLTRRLGPTKALQANHWLPAAWLQNIAARLMATRWFARNTIVENWFLHRRQETLQV